MKMKLFYLVAVGLVINNRGQTHKHGEVICAFDCDLSDLQRKQVADALGYANVDLVDSETYEREYKS